MHAQASMSRAISGRMVAAESSVHTPSSIASTRPSANNPAAEALKSAESSKSLFDTALDALYALLEPPAWHQHAACRGMGDLFFPNVGESNRSREARAVCAGCPVRTECAAAGLWEADGVWGGMTETARRHARRGTTNPRPVNLSRVPVYAGRTL